MKDKIKVIISDDQKDVKIPTGTRMLVRRCCNAVLKNEKFEGSAEISVRFVNNEEIHRLNKEFRGVDSSTDVLSFPLGENGEYDINNDTIILQLNLEREESGDIVVESHRIYPCTVLHSVTMKNDTAAGTINRLSPISRIR